MNSDESSEKQFVDFFIKAGRELHYKKNEIIMRPDNPPSGVYCIKKGYVRTYSITESGSEKVHIIYKPGDIFPLIWALRGTQKDLFYQTMNDAQIIKAKKNDFLSYIYSDPTANYILLQKLVGIFNMFSDRIDNLEVSKTYPRVVSSILFLARQYGEPLEKTGKKNPDSYVIMPPITHQDIANFSTVTRETTSREISALERKKLISYKNHLIVVNSIKNLEKELLHNTAT